MRVRQNSTRLIPRLWWTYQVNTFHMSNNFVVLIYFFGYWTALFIWSCNVLSEIFISVGLILPYMLTWSDFYTLGCIWHDQGYRYVTGCLPSTWWMFVDIRLPADRGALCWCCSFWFVKKEFTMTLYPIFPAVVAILRNYFVPI